jgi:hypothetical protein
VESSITVCLLLSNWPICPYFLASAASCSVNPFAPASPSSSARYSLSPPVRSSSLELHPLARPTRLASSGSYTSAYRFALLSELAHIYERALLPRTDTRLMPALKGRGRVRLADGGVRKAARPRGRPARRARRSPRRRRRRLRARYARRYWRAFRPPGRRRLAQPSRAADSLFHRRVRREDSPRHFSPLASARLFLLAPAHVRPAPAA